MEAVMLCPVCSKGTLVETRENYKYVESGLDDVTLMGIPIQRCPECGEELVEIQNMEGLHRSLALEVIEQASLGPKEIRFLRKHLGWSQVELAKHLRVDAATANRWESGKNPMGDQAQELLRLAVWTGKKILDYDKETGERRPARRLVMKAASSGWETAPA